MYEFECIRRRIPGTDYCGLGGGSGGGTSGKVDYPTYMKTTHNEWLDNTGAASVTTGNDITSLMMTAIGANPFSSLVAYDPDSDIAAALAKVVNFEALNFNTFVASVLSNTLTPAVTAVDAALGITDTTSYLNSLVDAYSDQIQADVEQKALPIFERGMQDINAVMSSAFVIGRALILAEKDRNVARYTAEQYLRAFEHRITLLTQAMDTQLKAFSAEAVFKQAVAHLFTEAYRIKIVAKKEEIDTEMHIEEAIGKWPLEAYHYGCNVMACIGSASVQTAPKPNRFMSAIGGALSGAGVGAMLGSPITAGIGGLLGGLFG